jgi:hypothetical protein
MRKLRGTQYSFKQQTHKKLQNKVLGPLASNMNDSLTEATLHLPFSCMGPFSVKVRFLILKSLRGRHYSLTQQTQFIMLSKLLDPLPSTMKDCIRSSVFLLSLERGSLAQSWCSSSMKTLRLRQCSFQKPTQFTMLNKVVDLLASNFNVSLWRATLFLPFTIGVPFAKVDDTELW